MRMPCYTLVAAAGDLAKADCQPTVYRKHTGGVTSLEESVSFSLHFNSILLWEKMKEIVPTETERINQVILQHLMEIFTLTKAPLSELLNQIGDEKIIKTIGKKNLLKNLLG